MESVGEISKLSREVIKGEGMFILTEESSIEEDGREGLHK